MRKILSLLLSAALCAVGINTTVFAEESKTSLVYIESATGETGDTVSIPIGIKDNQGIISLVTEISYDTTALKLVSVNKNAEFWKAANMTPGGDYTAQPYRIIWYDGLATSDFTENGTLANLSFEILNEGSHEIELSVSDSDTFNSEFISVPVAVSNGVVEVSSESKTTTTESATTTTTTTTSTTATTKPTTTTTTSTTTTTEPPTTPAEPISMGDVNEDGSVDATDASLVLYEYAVLSTGGSGSYSEIQKTVADVNFDGIIDAADASEILSFYAYLLTGGTETDMINWHFSQLSF